MTDTAAIHEIRAVAFDLDGTLVDSAGGVAHALNAALREHGLPTFTRERIRGWIGDGPDLTIRRALDASGHDGAASDELAHRLRISFDEATLRQPMADSRVFDGIAEMLAALDALPRVVVTNKPTALARAVLSAAGLLPCFAEVLGADRAVQRKPSAHLLTAAANHLDVPTRSLLMVGDSLPDVGAARAAGCPMAWAAWGYGTGPLRSDADACHLATPAELPRWVAPRSSRLLQI